MKTFAAVVIPALLAFGQICLAQGSAEDSCLAACAADDVNCKADCVGVPHPNGAQTDASNQCATKCVQGDGSPAATDAYARCQAACFVSYYFGSGNGAVASPGSSAAAAVAEVSSVAAAAAPTVAASASGTGKATSVANTTGISKATATATATASDNATATAAKTSSATSSAAAIPNVQVAAPAVGFMGLLVALAAI